MVIAEVFKAGRGFCETDLISQQIAFSAPAYSDDQKQLIQSAISDFEKTKGYMYEAEMYFQNKNLEVAGRKRMTMGRDMNDRPSLCENHILSNNKLYHNFTEKLTNQKLAYVLGKQFSFQNDNKDEEERFKDFLAALKPYLTKSTFKKIKLAATQSILKRTGWILMYYDEQGNLKDKWIPTEDIIPIWNDYEHEELGAAIWKRDVELFSGGQKEIVTYVDYMVPEGVYHYRLANDEIVTRVDVPFFSPYFMLDVPVAEQDKIDIVNYAASWNQVPLIPFKYSSNERSILDRIKSLIDDYDAKTSEISNEISDHPNSIMVVKNYDGRDVNTFTHNVNVYRKVFVHGDGDAKALNTPINVSDVYTHIKQLKDDIYEFGQGVNTANKDMRDTSGTALRFLYGDLDMDCIHWSTELELSISKMIDFYLKDIMIKTGEDYTNVEYSILFSRDVIVNESEIITNAVNSKGIIPLKIIMSKHPWILDAESAYTEFLEERREEKALEDSGEVDPVTYGDLEAPLNN